MKKKWIKLVLFIFGAFLLGFITEEVFLLFHDRSLSIDRIIIFSFIYFVISSFFLFGYKKELDFIYKYRYLIGIILFAYIVLNSYIVSSIDLFDSVIQPKSTSDSFKTILGSLRTMRNDEWAVSSPTVLSQSRNNFNTISNIIMARSSNVSLWPGVPAMNFYIISKPEFWAFLFLPVSMAFSWSNIIGYFILFFATFEFAMLLTSKNKMFSFCTAIIITFSTYTLWWEAWNYVAFGELAIIFLDKYLNSDKKIRSILWAFLFAFAGTCFCSHLYPAWQVPFGYMFLAFAIWIISKNSKQGKHIFRRVLLLCFLTILMITVIIIPSLVDSFDIFTLMSNTVYPGARIDNGGFNISMFFYYFVNIFTSIWPETVILNSPEISSFISLYPIPLVIATYYFFKDKKHDILLGSLVIVAILLSVWNFVPISTIVLKLTLLSYSGAFRSAPIVSLICVYLVVYLSSNYFEKESINKCSIDLKILFLALTMAIIGIAISKITFVKYFRLILMIFDLIVYTILFYLLLDKNKNTKKVLLVCLAALTFFSGIKIKPLSKGIDVIYQKPFAKEVQSIVKKDKDAIWITADSSLSLGNYLVANGARTISSVNYYPNFDLWKVIDPKGEYSNVYNRYAHLLVSITSEEDQIELASADVIYLKLNINTACKLNIDYIASENDDLEEESSDNTKLTKVYEEENMIIYEVSCK